MRRLTDSQDRLLTRAVQKVFPNPGGVAHALMRAASPLSRNPIGTTEPVAAGSPPVSGPEEVRFGPVPLLATPSLDRRDRAVEKSLDRARTSACATSSLAAAILFAALFAATASAQTKAPSFNYKDLKYPPLGQVKVPEPTEVTLSNGMRVFLLEDHELPLISGSATIRTGNLFDPPGKIGVADLTAAVMRSGGTSAKTGDQLDVELENIAASVESSMGETSASVSFSALKETADTALGIFKDVLSEPGFRQDKIDLALSQVRSGISRRNDDADAIPDRELLRIVYGRDTPYGWQIEYSDLAAIHRDDLLAFYRRYYFPKNIMLAVYGDFNTAEMKDKLEKLFGGWKVEQQPVPAFPPVTAKPAPGIYLADKDRRHPDLLRHRRAGRHAARSGLRGAGGGGGYSRRRIPQPPVPTDPHQAGLRVRRVGGRGRPLTITPEHSASWAAPSPRPPPRPSKPSRRSWRRSATSR